MNEKKNCIVIDVDRTNLDKCEKQVDRIIKKLKEANSLADELASKTNSVHLVTSKKGESNDR